MASKEVYEIIERWRNKAKALETERPELIITPGYRGAVVNHFNKYLGSDALRRAFFGLMFAADHKPMSSKLLKVWEVAALAEWIDYVKDDGDGYVSNQFISDCAMIRGFYGVQSEVLIPGVSIFDSFCSACGTPTNHLYLGYRTVCLRCYPEQDYRGKAVE